MDAVEFLKKLKRMCDKNRDSCHGSCYACEIFAKKVEKAISCSSFIQDYPEEAIAIIEKWSTEHPTKTRKSEFLKLFPNVPVDDNGVPFIMPCNIEYEAKKECERHSECGTCREEFWLAEMDDEKS